MEKQPSWASTEMQKLRYSEVKTSSVEPMKERDAGKRQACPNLRHNVQEEVPSKKRGKKPATSQFDYYFPFFIFFSFFRSFSFFIFLKNLFSCFFPVACFSCTDVLGPSRIVRTQLASSTVHSALEHVLCCFPLLHGSGASYPGNGVLSGDGIYSRS